MVRENEAFNYIIRKRIKMVKDRSKNRGKKVECMVVNCGKKVYKFNMEKHLRSHENKRIHDPATGRRYRR